MRGVLILLGVLLAGGAAWGQSNPSFNLVNRSGQPIGQVFATPTGVDRWGQDRLQQSFIAPGGRFPVRLPEGDTCVYDVRVVYADGRAEERRHVDVCRLEAMAFPNGAGDQASRDQGGGPGAGQSGGPGGPQRGQGDPSFRVVNAGRAELSELYATVVGVDDWGPDRLGEGTVAVGRTFVVRLPAGRCLYDVKAVFSNREIVERRRVDLCSIRDLRVP